jgi:hypothetical protein
MESMAVAPGFARAIAGTGPVFAAFLVPHILAGLTAISRKGSERHVRAGTAYFGAITVLAATAAGLTAIRVPAAAGGGCLRIPAQLRVPSPSGALADLGQPVQPSEVTQHAER